MIKLFLGVIGIFGVSNCFANAPFDFSTKDEGPTEVKILADHLECDQLKGVCTAQGNASAQKLNDPELKTIVADKLLAYFEKGEKDKEKEKPTQAKEAEKKEEKEASLEGDTGLGHMKLVRLEAHGDVVMTTRENVIQGDRAEYKVQEDLVEVFGKNVKITNNENQLNGNYCQANLKTGKYKMIKEGGRVQALINQNKKQDKK